MRLSRWPLIAAALSCLCLWNGQAFAASPAEAQLVVKNGASPSVQVNIDGQTDAAGFFHYRDVLEGLDSGGAPQPWRVNSSGQGSVLGAVGSFADGWNVTAGAQADAVCSTDTGTCGEIALLKRENARLTAIITALGSPFQAGGSIGNTAFGATQSGAWNITNISGTVSLPTGAATSAAQTTAQTSLSSIDTKTPALNGDGGAAVHINGGSIANTSFASPASPTITGPSSTLTLPSATTAYTSSQLIANSATAGSVVVPSFAIANSAGGAIITGLRLSTNDATSTAWGGQPIQVDLWLAAPTFANGDRGAWSPATGTGNHLRTFTCLMSAEYGDGAYAECSPAVGSFSMPKLASGTSVFWTLSAPLGSGVTGASKTFTLIAETMN